MSIAQADLEIGAAVRKARELTGLRQKDLATNMRGRGFSWHQATVGMVENGERPLRVSEAYALAEVIMLELFVTPDPQTFREAAAFRRMRDAMQEVGDDDWDQTRHWRRSPGEDVAP
ncbi:helix-turn-helix transcriptional regulator [Microbacterium sp. NPDC089190]|uniref:helix-turn-helix domain-containing protein n=1 Tax=Microbacterium sp. NPDC089190 TaxID=3155063 RepID=UPI003450D030